MTNQRNLGNGSISDTTPLPHGQAWDQNTLENTEAKQVNNVK